MNAPVSLHRAWNLLPDEYVDRRPVEFALTVPKSHYVTMRDGCRIAVDIYVPQSLSGAVTSATFPAIALFTPYYRRFKLRPGGTGEANPNTGKYRDFFVPRGYASWWSMCAAPARVLGRATVSARRRSVRTAARSQIGLSRSLGLTASSGRLAFPILVPPRTFSPAPDIPPSRRSRRCSRSGTPIPTIISLAESSSSR